MKKKLLLVLFLAVTVISSISAAGFTVLEDSRPLHISFVDFGMGYGYTGYSYNSSSFQNEHAVNLVFNSGYVEYRPENIVSIGLETRLDFMIEASDRRMVFDFLIGPLFMFPINSHMDIQLAVGPSFNFLTGVERRVTVFSIGPAADLALEFYGGVTDAISFKCGVVVSGQFGIGDSLFGITASPYISMSLRGNGIYFIPPSPYRW